MPQSGVRTTDLAPLTGLDHVVGNKDGATGLLSVDTLTALIGARSGPSFELLSELLADLDWNEGVLAMVWGDASDAINGLYQKSGASGAGAWTRIGDLPITSVAASVLSTKANATDLDALEVLVASLAAGLTPAGSWDASLGSFPTGAAAQTFYVVSRAGTVDGQTFAVGDWLIALSGTPSTSVFAGNWARADYSEVVSRVFGYVERFSDLALVLASDVGVGGFVTVQESGHIYRRVATGGHLDYTSTGGLRFDLQLNNSGRLPLTGLGLDVSATVGSEAENTTIINQAIATGYDLEWPTGQIRVNGTIDGREGGAWFGAGWGLSPYNSAYDGSGTFIQLIGDNGGDAFILPPKNWTGFHIDGVDKAGKGVQVGENGSFTGAHQWSFIRIRRCSLGFDYYNCFLFHGENVEIMDCTNGVRHAPTDGAGDDGYSTTTRWTNWQIADCDSWGLDLSPALLTETWTWNQVVIERNAASSGSWQMRTQNMGITGHGIYLEGTSSKPCLSCSTSAFYGSGWYVNGTGGFDLNNQANTFDLGGLRMTGVTDTLDNVAGTSRLFFRRSIIQTDITGLPATKQFDYCSIAGVVYDETRIQRLSVGLKGDDQPQPLSLIQSFTTTFSGTVTAGSRATVFTNELYLGIFDDAVAFASIEGYQRDLLVTVTAADSGSLNYLSLVIRNFGSSDVVLSSAKINILVVRAGSQIAI